MLPKGDAAMLMSFINMKLRDFYGSFDELCDDLDEDRGEILEILTKAGFRYDPETNSFK